MGKATRGRGRRTAEGSKARELPDFSTLPARVAHKDLRTTHDVDPGPDPQGGRDTETEFLLRHGGP